MSIFDLVNTAVTRAFDDDAPITLTRNGVETAIEGIFDSRYYEVETGEGLVGGSTLTTTVSVDLAATGPIARGDGITARGTAYRVKDLRPDGQGMTVLELERA